MRSETGVADNVVNIPLRAGTGSAAFRRIAEAEVLPRVAAFKPEMIFISAGFDAHRADPLANINLEADDYAWITGRLCDLADELCQGRVVSALEGGYDLEALGASVAAHVGMLRERG
jgi:acetoin utilization deacetylase AcuC-like enzyme